MGEPDKDVVVRIVHAEWVKQFGQIELRTTRPSTGLRPRVDAFVGVLLGMVRRQWAGGRATDGWQAVFRGPPDGPPWRDVTAPRGTPPQDYCNDLEDQATAMGMVESRYRERNPGVRLLCRTRRHRS